MFESIVFLFFFHQVYFKKYTFVEFLKDIDIKISRITQNDTNKEKIKKYINNNKGAKQ